MVKKPFYGILVVLMVAIFGVIAATQAQEQPGSSFTAPVMYELTLTNDSKAEEQWSTLEAQIPPGSEYVGLAVGSQIGAEAVPIGNRLVWQGPFSVPPDGELVLRYWLAPTTPALEAPPMEVSAQRQNGEAVSASAQPATPVSIDRVAPEEVASPEAVTIQKIAETEQLTPDDHPWIAYQVIFTNSSGSPAVLDEIRDTLAPGSQFGGMAYESDEAWPEDRLASTIVWPGPHTIPGGGTFELRYWVKPMLTPGDHTNSAQATAGSVTIGPATASVTVLSPDLSLTKNASHQSVTVGDMVTYDVTVSNSGGYQGVIDVISDTLPAGLTFDSMDPASDWGDPDIPSANPLVWTEPVTVPVSSEVHLIYQVRATGAGSKTNSVIARDNHEEQVGPVEKTIEVLPVYVFLPLISRTERSTTLPMEEGFTTGIPAEWVPFVNYPELQANDWYYVGDHATWGRYDFNAGEPLSQYALSMYLGEGAEEWVNYKIETTFRAGKEWKSTPKLVGIWFRGTYEERVDNQGGDVGGYMFLLKPDEHPDYGKAYVGHIDPATRQLGFVKDVELQVGNDNYTFHDVIIDVQGANIKVFLDGNPIPLIDWTDPNDTWKHGTVGFVVYQGAAAFDNIRVTELP